MPEQASPAEMLAIVEEQQQKTAQRLGPNPAALFGPWGLAWLLGFGLLYLTVGPAAPVDLPLAVALTVFFALLIAAGAITGILSARAGSGIRGPGMAAAAMYGWSWTLGFGGFIATMIAASRLGLSFEARTLLWTAGSCLLVGVLFLGAGAVFNDWPQYAIGCWLLVINGFGAFTGTQGHYLVLSLGGGGCLLAAAVIFALMPRTRVDQRTPDRQEAAG